MERQVREALQHFSFEGKLTGVEALKRGHIHDTFVSTWRDTGGTRQFLHQRVNEDVFPSISLLMRNIRRVTEHISQKLAGVDSGGFKPLRLVPTTSGESFARNESGAWRTFVFVANTTSYDICTSPEQAYEAARLFGWFQAQLSDLPASELGEVIPNFFSSPFRYRQFLNALEGATEVRRTQAGAEVQFAKNHAATVTVIDDRLKSGAIPTRVVHGDTKLNNVLFDTQTAKAKSIVDLDTCMPGYSLYDFGDLVRFTAATSVEDETDMAKVGTDLTLYRALVDGYLSTARDFLLDEEIELMPFAARLVTLTIGLRFLADYLAGDVYFKVTRPEQNLDRARTQFGMVRFMEQHEAEMKVR